MKHTRIYGALIVIAISLALLLLVFFGVDIKVSKTVATKIEEGNIVYVYLDGKQYEYANNNPTNVYYITNPKDNTKDKCYLNQDEKEKGKFICKKVNGFDFSWGLDAGVYPTTLEFGSMKLFQYFICF